MPKKTNNQIKINHYEKELKIDDIKIVNLENEINKLNDKIQDMIDLRLENSINDKKLGKLYDLEIIDKEGNLIDR